jgi:hypothetical protein
MPSRDLTPEEPHPSVFRTLTINANFITALDSFTVPPGGSVSRVYEVPGEVVAFLASPEHPPLAGIEMDFTVYGRAD